MYVHTNHLDIRNLLNETDVNANMIIWLLLLQEFDITIRDKPGKHNVVAYFLSRPNHVAYKDVVDDAFLDEHLFSISVQTPWFANIENYLVTRMFPQHFSYQECCKIIRQSVSYSWIRGYLFKIGQHNILRRHIREYEAYESLHACDTKPCGGHY